MVAEAIERTICRTKTVRMVAILEIPDDAVPFKRRWSHAKKGLLKWSGIKCVGFREVGPQDENNSGSRH